MEGEVRGVLAAAVLAGACASALAVTFTEWRAARFDAAQLADPEVSGQFADPDGDGLSNVEEYAFATDPLAASADGRPFMAGSDFVFRKLKGASDLLYQFQFSGDLAIWSTPNNPDERAGPDGGEYATRIIADLSAPAPRYFRLRILQNPGGPNPLVAPGDPAAEPASDATRIDLRWSDLSAVETGFLIERKAEGESDFSAVGSAGADEALFSDVSVLPGTTYTYRIRSVQGGALSGPSLEVQAVAPTGPAATAMADAAVDLVRGQIKLATSGFEMSGTDYDLNRPLAWASQPGMLRTWDDRGNPSKVYKLYASPAMVEEGAAFDPSGEAAALEGWKSGGGSFNALWCDLNSPAVSSAAKGDLTYPITAPPDNLDPANGVAVDDPATDQQEGVQGFAVANPPRFDPVVAPGPDNNPAPMPVRWLYVLKNGQKVAASGSHGAAHVPGASSANPIIGRIAFWADDETCKVNVNTASEGVFWDVPVCASLDEMPLAANPPVKGEFQRQPGHPAMTCLSAVFGGSLPIDHGPAIPASGALQPFRLNLEAIYDFCPRIEWGTAPQGSQGGTSPVPDPYYAYAPAIGDLYPNVFGSGAQTLPISTAIFPDSDRLFSSLDAILLKPDGSPQDPRVATADSLKRQRFFLTAHSRAPEVNLFNLPRVALWPITWPYRSAHLINSSAGRLPATNGDPTRPLSENPWMAPEERLLAEIAQLGKASDGQKLRYFFQRQNPDSPTHDWDNIARNRDLLDGYLRRLTSMSVPGFGAALADKYGPAGRDAILVNAFDAIRSTVNLSTTGTDSVTGAPKVLYDFAGNSFRLSVSGGLWMQDVPSWQVMPIRASLGGMEQKGFGAFPSPVEVALLFYATKRNDPWPVPMSGTAGPFTPSYLITASNPQTTEMRMVVLLSEFSPASVLARPSYWVKASGSPFRVNGAPIGFPASGGNVVQMKTSPYFIAPPYAYGFCWNTYGKSAKALAVGGPSSDAFKRWEFVSDPIPINPADGTMFSFGGSKVTFEIFATYSHDQNLDPTGSQSNKVQTVEIDFGRLDGTAAVPLAPRWTVNQIIPQQAVAAGVPSSGSGPYYARSFSPNSREISPRGYYLYQDEGFDVAKSGTLIWNTKGYISPNWEYRMICASGRDYTPIKSNYFTAPSYYPRYGTSASATIIGPYDTVLSMVLSGTGPALGDARVLAARREVPADLFVPAWTGPSRNYDWIDAGTSYPRTTQGWQRHSIGRCGGAELNYLSCLPGHIGSGAPYDQPQDKITLMGAPMATSGASRPASDASGSLGEPQTSSEVGVLAFGRTAPISNAPLGDWTNNSGNSPDGCSMWMPDQLFRTFDSDYSLVYGTSTTWAAWVPFFSYPFGTAGDRRGAANYFSIHRQIPSAITLLGTLPAPDTSGVPQPWQTLLFCPNPAIGAAHPGFGSIGSRAPDHLLLDLFWLPVAEPYALSDPLSTEGKINLNYRMMPFGHIRRATGLHALMKSTKITAIPNSGSMLADYKSAYQMRTVNPHVSTRLEIDVEATLQAFEDKFQSGDLFRAASQICEMFLVPAGRTLAEVRDLAAGFWSGQQLTGDNSREAPYSHLYPRITTKSDTYQVHYRVQVLKKASGSPSDLWVEGVDTVVAESRGSRTIERQFDHENTDIPDYATAPNATPIDAFYRFAYPEERRFDP